LVTVASADRRKYYDPVLGCLQQIGLREWEIGVVPLHIVDSVATGGDLCLGDNADVYFVVI
jgi:hypothetical protein